MMDKKKHLPFSQGFTLPDVIIVLAILAIVITAIFPTISSYLANSRIEEEVNQQAAIIDAFDVYFKETGQLPTTPSNANILTASNFNQAWNRTNTVFTSGTVVTNLSRNDMRNDQFGARRGLLADSETITFTGGDYEVYYIAVISLGEDGCYGNPVPTCNALPTSFASLAAPGGTFNVDDFNALVVDPDSDDIITKYTDAPLKKEAYNQLLLQITEMEEALDFYARQKFLRAQSIITADCQSAVTIDTTPPFTSDYSLYDCYSDVRNGARPAVAATMPDEGRIFYPPSQRNRAGGTVALAPYGLSVRGANELRTSTTAAIAAAGGAGNRIYNQNANIETRKTGMKALTSMLGLPTRMCCNPLKKYYNPTSDRWEEEPLYYFSDPRGIQTGP